MWQYTEILWVISTYCCYVWNERVAKGSNYTICVDKLRSVMMQEYEENQLSQNHLEYIQF